VCHDCLQEDKTAMEISGRGLHLFLARVIVRILLGEKTSFLMGMHKRIGANSPISTVLVQSSLYDSNVLRLIFSFLTSYYRNTFKY